MSGSGTFDAQDFSDLIGHPEPPAGAAPTDPARETPPGLTGRFLVLLDTEALPLGVDTLTSGAGLHVVSSAEHASSPAAHANSNPQAIVYDELGVAVVAAPVDQMEMLSALADSAHGILAMEPERVVYAVQNLPAGSVGPLGITPDYLRGYRTGVDQLVDALLSAGPGGAAGIATLAPAQIEETLATWGLEATLVTASTFSGQGIRVAVLDTGMDLAHPDFAGRTIVAESFIDGETVDDGRGHGTHCIGTACGPLLPAGQPRYGIAFEAAIYVGKVLSNAGSGTDRSILAGIEWALQHGCEVISMSLGAPVFPGQRYSRVFETVAKRVLDRGTLIVAAAGNDSARPWQIDPVSHPANCPSIVAVGALDPQLGVAGFSNGGVNRLGGEVDIAAPGVRVLSSWPGTMLHNYLSGTSMATPHVAGIAALYAEADEQLRGQALRDALVRGARPVQIPARDAGAGIVQAP